jgi:hypothetical protein
MTVATEHHACIQSPSLPGVTLRTTLVAGTVPRAQRQSFLAHGLEGHRPERPPFPCPGGGTGQPGAGGHGGAGAACRSPSGGVGEPSAKSRVKPCEGSGVVGWVEWSETHRSGGGSVGLAPLNPPYSLWPSSHGILLEPALGKPAGCSVGRRADTGGRHELDRAVPRPTGPPTARLPAQPAVPHPNRHGRPTGGVAAPVRCRESLSQINRSC